MEASAFAAVRGKMLYPVRVDDAKAMEQDIRNRADTQYHPVGSCKMGPDSDPMAVVDAQLRVKGVDGLRVACLLYTSPSPRDRTRSRMPSSA